MAVATREPTIAARRRGQVGELRTQPGSQFATRIDRHAGCITRQAQLVFRNDTIAIGIDYGLEVLHKLQRNGLARHAVAIADEAAPTRHAECHVLRWWVAKLLRSA